MMKVKRKKKIWERRKKGKQGERKAFREWV
jgi:hypothetical protein